MRIYKLLVFVLVTYGIGIKADGNNAIKTIHVYVALCDNENQGIVPVPDQLGKGDQPGSNLYWGAVYGMKSFFRYKTNDWELLKSTNPANANILERVIFKHKTRAIYIIADAYKGISIKQCITDFLLASNWQNKQKTVIDDVELGLGGNADLLGYIGHDGLMEFEVNPVFNKVKEDPKEVMILACYSKTYFTNLIKKAEASPILWTTHLMAPEAYTIKAAIDGWIGAESYAEIEERAAQAYHSYQKCGIRGARNLFTYGFE